MAQAKRHQPLVDLRHRRTAYSPASPWPLCPAPLLVATPLHCRPPSEDQPVEWGLRVVTDTQAKITDTTTSLEADGDTYNTSGPTYHHSTPSTGRKSWRGMAAAVETPPGIKFSSTIKRAPTEQRRQRRTLVETSATIDSPGQSHP